MKFSKAATHSKGYRVPTLRFEDQRLTSFAGLVLFQSLFALLQLSPRLRACFRHQPARPIFGQGRIVLLLIVHLLLGYRRLQDMRYYRDDPVVGRVLGLQRLPDVATVSRSLAGLDARSADNLRALNRQLVGTRLAATSPARVTLDFDGSVIATGRCAEGTAVGFNRKKKGQRSYYPLFCTVAQTGQVFDVWHRPGNVHDSNGAAAFIQACLQAVRALLPRSTIEVRMDSAFFSEAIVRLLSGAGVEFTVSVPFARFAELKAQIEARVRWRQLDAERAFFESPWKPKSWDRRHRFLFIRTRNRLQSKEPVQLDLFVPHEYGYDFKVIVTNKCLSAKKTVAFHHGRGAQEGVFAELKSQAQMDYVPTRREVGNRIFLLAGVMAHNLNRELQMRCQPQQRHTTEKRTPLWRFEQLGTLRHKLIQRAGRLTQPHGELTLTLSANPLIKSELLHNLRALQQAA